MKSAILEQPVDVVFENVVDEMAMRSWCGAAGFSWVNLASLLTIISLPQGTEADFAS